MNTSAAACALTLAAALTAPASAANLTQLIAGGGHVFISDENGETFIDANNNGLIDIGDEFRGVMSFDQFQRDLDPAAALLHAAGNSELGGVFHLRVTAKSASAIPGAFNYVFAPVASFEALYGAGAMIVLWEDPNLSHFDVHTAASQLDAINTVTDGNLFMKLGLVDGDDHWRGRGPEDPLNLGTPSTRLLEYFFALSRTAPDGLAGAWNLSELSNGIGAGEFIGSSQVGGAFPGSPWAYSSETSGEFTVTAIPTPSAFSATSVLILLLTSRPPSPGKAHRRPRSHSQP